MSPCLPPGGACADLSTALGGRATMHAASRLTLPCPPGTLQESMKNVHNIEKLAPGGQVDMGALSRQLGAM